MDLIVKIRRPNGTLDIFPCDWVQLRRNEDDPDDPKYRYVALSQDGSTFQNIDMASEDAADVYVEQAGELVTHIKRYRPAAGEPDAESAASESATE